MKTIAVNFREMVENAIGIFYKTDESGRISYISPRVKAIFSVSQEEVLGRPVFDFLKSLPLKDKETQLKFNLDLFSQMISKKGEEFSFLLELETPEKKYFQVDCRLLWDKTKRNLLGSEGIINDISNIYQLLQKLRESEEKFRAIFQNANDGIFLIDINPKGIPQKIREVNKKACEMLGYSKDELLKLSSKDIAVPGRFEEQIADQMEDLRLKKHLIYEARLVKKDGRKIPVELSAHLFELQEELVLLLVSRDITDRRKSEQELRESEEKYRLITEYANDLICILDEKFKHLFINERTYARELGYTQEDLIGKSALKWIHPEDRANILSIIQKGLITGRGHAQARVQNKDGTYKWFDITGSLYIDTHGNQRAIIVYRNIEESKRAVEKLRASEAKYRLITENANDLICVLNENFEFEYINEAAYYNVTGYTKEDLLGKSTLEFIDPTSLQDANKKLAEGFRAGGGTGEARIRIKDGSYRWFETKGASFTDITGKKKALIISRDITKRKEAEQKLRESEEKYRLITENANELICVVDGKYRFIYVNPQFTRVLGYPQDEILGKDGMQLIHPTDLMNIKKKVQLRQHGDVGRIDARVKHKKGYYIWFELTGQQYSDTYGKENYLLLMRDITERKSMEETRLKFFEQMERQNRELKEIDRMKDEFFADISHELRTPLVAIKGFSELLLKARNLDKIQRQDIQIILRNEIRLERLVGEILDYFRLKSRKVSFKEDTFRVSELLADLKKELEPIIQEKQVEIQEEYLPDGILLFDKFQITKVIKNLLTNAIKFSFPKGKILLKSVIENGIWTFAIQDQGIGMSKEDRTKIFSRFTRLDSAKGMNLNGIGLGLAICKKVIDIYRGKIWVESKGINKGSTFYFQLKI
ncbi:MAG: PAS domain S-box protein [Candidatus Helarchaeota archaeon]